MDAPKIKPKVQAIIDRHAAIDWTAPPREVERVMAAYKRRLAVAGLTLAVRWVDDPADLDARDAWIARDARDAWVARAAWDARDAWAARAARAAWDARDAWAARAAVGWLNIDLSSDNENWLPRMLDIYTPMIDAYEGGAFAHMLLETEIVVLAAPSTHIDVDGRLHRDNGPALKWRDTAVYAWHGTVIPAHWIEARETLDPAEVIAVENVEQRAAGAEIVGWAKMLDKLDAKVIDDSGSDDIGQLIEMTLPGLDQPGRFLKAVCPRNGIICEGVPRISDIDGQPIDTAVAAQAWRVGDPLSDYEHPTRRT